MARGAAVWVGVALVACSADAPRTESPDATGAAIASSTAPAREPTGLEPLIRKNVALAESAWATKSTEALAALYTPDAVFVTWGGDGRRQETTAEMVRGLAGFWGGMAAVKMTTTRVVHAGDLAVAEWVVSGTTAERSRVGVAGVSLMWFAPSGLVTREHLYMDEQTVGMQLGEAGIVARPPIVAPTATRWVDASADASGDTAAVELAKTLYVALQRRDDARLAELFAPDAVHIDFSRPDDARGSAAIRAAFAALADAFPDRTITMARAHAGQGHVVVEGLWAGTMTGRLGAAEPTGRGAEVHFVDVLEIEGGVIARLTTYANGVELARAIAPATLPPPSPSPSR